MSTVESNSKEVTCERFVALFDIMGFKDKLYKQGHTAVLKDLKALANISKKVVDSDTSSLKSFLFSDTIVFISESNTENDFKEILRVGTFLIFESFTGEPQVPIKGAIACGTVTTSSDGNSIILGEPIIDAFNLGEEINYYGAVLHHSCEQLFSNIEYKNEADAFITRDKTKFKKSCATYYNLDVIKTLKIFLDDPLLIEKGSREKEIKGKLEEFKASLDNFYNSVSGKPREYVDNTLEFYKKNHQDVFK